MPIEVVVFDEFKSLIQVISSRLYCDAMNSSKYPKWNVKFDAACRGNLQGRDVCGYG